MYACIFGNMVAIVQRLYSRATHYHNNMTNVREFLRFYKIPHDVQDNINNYIRREWLLSPGIDAAAVRWCPQPNHVISFYNFTCYNVKYSILTFLRPRNLKRVANTVPCFFPLELCKQCINYARKNMSGNLRTKN